MSHFSEIRMRRVALWTAAIVLVSALGWKVVSSQRESEAEADQVRAQPLSAMLEARDAMLPLGSTYQAQVFLSRKAPADMPVRIVSTNPRAVRLASSEVIVPKGSRSAAFDITGAGLGSAEVSARAETRDIGTLALQVENLPRLPTLREAAARRKLLIGSAADADDLGHPSPLVTEPRYAALLGEQYNMLEPEGSMKWIVVHPQPDRFDFGPGDHLVSFARAHNMKVRGHNLCWALGNPQWLSTYRGAAPQTVAKLLHDHIQTVVSHFRGQVFAWDVVNEAFEPDTFFGKARLQDSIWYNRPGIGLQGTGYIEQAFRWAHEADPAALLFYNEELHGPGPKLDAVTDMLTDFVKRRVPIDGVGLQLHVRINRGFNVQDLTTVMDSITSLGLQVHITELDIALPLQPDGQPTLPDLQQQAKLYGDILEVCLRNPKCTAFQTWGFSDRHSWIPAVMPGFGAALPFDANYAPKPAFNTLLETLQGLRAPH